MILKAIRAWLSKASRLFKPEDVIEQPREGVSRRHFLMTAAATVVVAALPAAPMSEAHFVDLGTPLHQHTLLTPEWITREAMRILERNLTLVSTFDRSYDGRAFKHGQIVSVRTPSLRKRNGL